MSKKTAIVIGAGKVTEMRSRRSFASHDFRVFYGKKPGTSGYI